MRQDIKELWIKALDSGEYKQGTGALCYIDQYCCLGVLCEVIKDLPEVKATGWEFKTDPRYPDKAWFKQGDDRYSGTIPFAVARAIGEQKLSGLYITLNDDSHMDFESIATVVNSGVLDSAVRLLQDY